MKKAFEKKESSEGKYYVIGALILLILIVALIYLFMQNASSSGVKGELSANLDSNSISSGKSTFLLVSYKNIGDTIMNAKFSVSADDSQAVSVEYPDESLLSFKLYPGDSVSRRFNVTGTTKAVRTDYQISVSVLGDNETTLSSENIILSVKKN